MTDSDRSTSMPSQAKVVQAQGVARANLIGQLTELAAVGCASWLLSIDRLDSRTWLFVIGGALFGPAVARARGLPAASSIVTALVMIRAKMEVESSKATLRKSRDAYDAVMQRIPQVSLVRQAMDPERGPQARAISEVFATAGSEWTLLRAEIDRVLADEPQQLDFDRILLSQDRMFANMMRLNIAMQHFAASQQGVRRPTLATP